MISKTRNEVILALKLFVINDVVDMPEDVKVEARYLARESDTFHPEDEELTYAIDNQHDDDFADAIVTAGEELAFRMVDYFKTPWNFAPGYKVPRPLEVNKRYQDLLYDFADTMIV